MAQQDTTYDEAPAPKDGDLKVVATLAAQQLLLEKEVDAAVAALAKAQAALKSVAEQALPNAMATLGLSEFTLADGYKITVGVDYMAGITEANRPAAFAWLRENGHDDLIKREVSAAFGRGEDALAQSVIDAVRSLAPDVALTAGESVHSGSLKKFVREAIAAGVDVPKDVFSVFIKTIAKVKPPSKSKAQTLAAAKAADRSEF